MPLAGRKWLPREIVGLLHDAGWTDKNLIVMTAVVLAESDGYQEAYHENPDGTFDWGLYQLNSRHTAVTKEMAFDPLKATAFARKLFVAEGFKPWAAYTNKSYESRLLFAIEGVRNYWREKYGFSLV